MSTFILGGLIFGFMGFVIYKSFIKKGGSGGCDCTSCDCPVKAKTDETDLKSQK